MPYYIRKYNAANVDIFTWAKNTLTDQELIDFQTSLDENTALWSQYTNDELITVQVLYDTVFSSVLNEEITIVLGEKTTVKDSNTVLQMASSWEYWQARFVAEGGNDTVEYVA